MFFLPLHLFKSWNCMYSLGIYIKRTSKILMTCRLMATRNRELWWPDRPSSQVGETEAKGCVKQVWLLLPNAELGEVMSHVPVIFGGHVRRLRWLVTGLGQEIPSFSPVDLATRFWQLWLASLSVRMKTKRQSSSREDTVGRHVVCHREATWAGSLDQLSLVSLRQVEEKKSDLTRS